MFVANLIRKYNQWMRYRKILADLRSRSDRELEDFSFARSDLREIAWRGAER